MWFLPPRAGSAGASWKRNAMAFVAGQALAAAGLLAAPVASAQNYVGPGVTKTEILIGNSAPYSGPVSALASTMKAAAAYFRKVNEEGGINGRRIRFISYDDGYNPASAVDQTRKLVESDGVSLVFGSLGTPTNTAIQRYLNQKKVPQLFVMTGAARFHEPRTYPWSMGWAMPLKLEGKAASSYLRSDPAGKTVAILYQNDDFGRDFISGLKEAMGERWSSVVAQASYEVGAPAVDSELIQLKASGATSLVSITTPKYSAQVIRRVVELGWKPTILVPSSSASIGAVMRPAGVENATGVLSWGSAKDPDDAEWKDDPGVRTWRTFMDRYLPDGDRSDAQITTGYLLAQTLVATLRQSADDLSRKNIMEQANALRSVALDMLLPGITINTAQNDYARLSQVQMQRFNGRTWERFGPILDLSSDSAR